MAVASQGGLPQHHFRIIYGLPHRNNPQTEDSGQCQVGFVSVWAVDMVQRGYNWILQGSGGGASAVDDMGDGADNIRYGGCWFRGELLGLMSDIGDIMLYVTILCYSV